MWFIKDGNIKYFGSILYFNLLSGKARYLQINVKFLLEPITFQTLTMSTNSFIQSASCAALKFIMNCNKQIQLLAIIMNYISPTSLQKKCLVLIFCNLMSISVSQLIERLSRRVYIKLLKDTWKLKCIIIIGNRGDDFQSCFFCDLERFSRMNFYHYCQNEYLSCFT